MNILVCDGIESDMEKLTRILDYSYGSAVNKEVFHRVSDALSYVRSGAVVDICFLETITLEMNGIELARNLRADGYTGEIVFISRDNGYAPESYEVKALGYLLKPPMPHEVRDIVNKAEGNLKKKDTGGVSGCGAVMPEVGLPFESPRFRGIKRMADYLAKRIFDIKQRG